jgi:hypothetical protein
MTPFREPLKNIDVLKRYRVFAALFLLNEKI